MRVRECNYCSTVLNLKGSQLSSIARVIALQAYMTRQQLKRQWLVAAIHSYLATLNPGGVVWFLVADPRLDIRLLRTLLCVSISSTVITACVLL
mgnify:CR=1 FL=1